MACELNTQSYATLEDLRESGLPPAAIGSVEYTTQQKHLLRASRLADSYLRNRYTLPLLAPYDQQLIAAVVQIASWTLMVRRGFDPTTPGDAVIRMSYDDAINWLKSVSNGQTTLCVTQSNPESVQPVLGTSPARGFGGLTDNEVFPFVGPNSAGL